MRNLIAVFFISTLLMGCVKDNNKKNDHVVNIDSTIKYEPGGYRDIVLSITGKAETDTLIIYKAQGLYKQDTVGLRISLRKVIRRSSFENGELKNGFVNNGIVFNSIGSKSDKLLSAIAELYELDTLKTAMRKDQMVLTCANLNQNDIDYNSGEAKFKVFMETGDNYGELFVNFDFTKNLIFFNEKDIVYRKPVLLYLMKK